MCFTVDFFRFRKVIAYSVYHILPHSLGQDPIITPTNISTAKNLKSELKKSHKHPQILNFISVVNMLSLNILQVFDFEKYG